MGILRLGKSHGEERLEKACKRALVLQAYSVKSIRSILKCALEDKPLSQEPESPLLAGHKNIRGPDYYH